MAKEITQNEAKAYEFLEKQMARLPLERASKFHFRATMDDPKWGEADHGELEEAQHHPFVSIEFEPDAEKAIQAVGDKAGSLLDKVSGLAEKMGAFVSIMKKD